MVDEFVVVVQLEDKLVVYAEATEDVDGESGSEENEDEDESELEGFYGAVNLVPVTFGIIFWSHDAEI